MNQSNTPHEHETSTGENDSLRPSGIDVIGDVPWGTHFCEFYNTQQDLVETLVPYFKAGLTNNEFCMWVTSAPLQVEEALEALRLEVPDLDTYLARGQIEVLDYRDWYMRGNRFDLELVLQGWIEKLAGAQKLGFAGLRLTGNTFWLEQTNWEDFTRYEEAINAIMGGQNMIALCTYSLQKCGVREILDVVANHQFALIKTGGHWEIIESAAHHKIEHDLRVSEERYRSLFTELNEGMALHEIICDEAGKPVDYRFLEVNPAFEQLTGLSKEAVVGHTILELIPDIEPFWIETYGQVALTGKPIHFQNSSQSLGRHFEVRSFSPHIGQFASLFIDITERKHMEEQAREAAAHITLQHRLIEQREQERLQIAQELHDGPVQELTGASFGLQSLISSSSDNKQVEDLRAVRQVILDQIASLRAFSQDLRPPMLAHFGVDRAIQAHLENFRHKHPDLSIHYEARPGIGKLTETAQLALYRIYQEAMNNVVKHAQASLVEIFLGMNNSQIELSVRDDGIGFVPPEDWLRLAQQGHLGLVGVRERAEAVNGSIKIISAPGKGTNLTVSIPVLISQAD